VKSSEDRIFRLEERLGVKGFSGPVIVITNVAPREQWPAPAEKVDDSLAIRVEWITPEEEAKRLP
jgi:hypothetical protein